MGTQIAFKVRENCLLNQARFARKTVADELYIERYFENGYPAVLYSSCHDVLIAVNKKIQSRSPQIFVLLKMLV